MKASDREISQASVSVADLARLVEDSLNEIFIFSMDDLRFVMINRQARENLGYTNDELRCMTPVDIKPYFDTPRFLQAIEPLTNGQVNKLIFETVHERKDKSEYSVEVHLQRGELAGRQVYCAIILDITERKKSEAARKAMELQILETQKLESLGVLAGGIAHDFNNILTSILGYADLARISCPPDSETYEYIDQLLKGATRGAELIKQMLAYSGKGRFIVEPIIVQELIQEIGSLLEVSISKNCNLQFYFDKNIPPIEADATQLRQVILNLILNASEAIGDEQGLITVRVGKVQADRQYLSSSYFEEDLPEQEYITLEVSDSGMGMDAETIEKIFEPFFTTKFTGRGLGLAAIMGIVKGHKGALRVYSEPGKGTTFKILLPSSLEMGQRNSRKLEITQPIFAGGNILIIDDEQQVRDIATTMFNKLGFSVITANDGEEGLSRFRELSDKLSLVLLDMTMPKMDGAAVFSEIRRINNNVPTILSSGYNEQTTTNHFAGKGLAGFLQKPYTIENLTNELARVLVSSNADREH